MGASCVFKLSFEVKQGSCLLHLLRKIYLYLQYDASNTVRAQVTVMWVPKKKKKRAWGCAPGSEMNVDTPVQCFDGTPHKVFCCTAKKHEPGGKKQCVTIHPAGEPGFILDIGKLSPPLFISLCYSFVTILLFSSLEHRRQGNSSSTANYY